MYNTIGLCRAASLKKQRIDVVCSLQVVVTFFCCPSFMSLHHQENIQLLFNKLKKRFRKSNKPNTFLNMITFSPMKYSSSYCFSLTPYVIYVILCEMLQEHKSLFSYILFHIFLSNMPYFYSHLSKNNCKR